ncbi:MAG: alanine--tRNA ligase [Pseudomonadota bacterium]
MKTAEIRQRFLDYFASHEHAKVASSSLVPGNDPTLLFTNAGMVQFKDLFLGNESRDYVRATTSQRCVRAGGKHNDLENVGYTARHHTFFEMLGNFSFGDYFKREAINYAWQFLTRELGLPAEKLWITVFEEDREAEDIWLNEIGINPDQFARIGEKDNFWAMGDVGPCGPCSEIFYDHGPEYWGGPPGTPEEDGDRFIEIWNLVFMQYDRSADGTMTPLPKPSVDTGMGLERIAAVLQHVNNNYEIDLFDNLIKSICEVVGTTDSKNHSVRVIADHIRSCAFLIADDVLPSNEGRGYVLRRIIRRAVRHGYQLGGQTPFFYKLVKPLMEEMGEAYPELIEKREKIETALEKEELRFAETLDQGLKIFEQKTEGLEGDTVPGELVFLLYDTYGFPADLTADVARERELVIDQEGFEALMEEQRERARKSSQFNSQDGVNISVESATDFIGYNYLKGSGEVLALQSDGIDHTSFEKEGDDLIIVLDKTPFYAEGGGQVGDVGLITASQGEVKVHDCKKLPNGAYMHFGKLVSGKIGVGETVQLTVNPLARYATAANHSATHLMHAALKQVLGDHVIQKGSMVNSERLRFDFSHDAPVSHEQIAEVENIVNKVIFSRQDVHSAIMPIEQAKAAGAEALFGEKYGDEVRVISMGDFSLELCGGTHVANTSEIGFFKIVGESGVAAGVRRIEALTQQGALDWTNEQQQVLQNLSRSLKIDVPGLPQRLAQLQDNIKALEGDKKKLQEMLASGGSQDLQSKIRQVGEVKVLATIMDGADKQLLRSTIDKFKDQHADGIIVLGAEVDGKVKLNAGVAKAISGTYPAGKLIQHLTALAGGRGGGRPDMAEGGIPDAGDLEKCLAAVEPWVQEQAAND